jgi:Trk K+ transport system NAD-binding subunit
MAVPPAQRPGHVVVCGDDTLAVRVVEELARMDTDVVALLPSAENEIGTDITALGAEVIQTSSAHEQALRKAGILTARSIVIVHEDDVGNIRTALTAEELNPGVRIVLRMFNAGLGEHLEQLFRNGIAISASGMAAPAFVSAALGESSDIQFIEVADRVLVVGPRDRVRGTQLAVLADTAGTEPELLPAVGGDLVLGTAGDGIRQRARRSLMAVTAVRHLVDRRLRIVLAAFLGLAVATTLAFSGRFGWYDAISLVTATGSPDLHVEDQPTSLRVVAAAVQLLGLLVVALLTAVVVDGLVGARLARVLGGVRGRLRDHVVVCGLGNVGVKVVRALRQRGFTVVAVERQEDRSTVATARRLGAAVVIGDATLEETLRSAQVERARAVIAVTSDDVTNLETGLVAHSRNTGARIVLRLFDAGLATQVDRLLGLPVSRSVSFLAAPAFAAAALERRVSATIPVGRRVLLTAELPVSRGSTVDGAALSTVDKPGQVRVLAVRPAGGRWEWQPLPRRAVAAGDRLAVVATRIGLAQAIGATRTPRD